MNYTERKDYGLLNELKKSIEQLKNEAEAKRLKVSESIKDLIVYCVSHENHDPLLRGIIIKDLFPNENSNIQTNCCAIV